VCPSSGRPPVRKNQSEEQRRSNVGVSLMPARIRRPDSSGSAIVGGPLFCKFVASKHEKRHGALNASQTGVGRRRTSAATHQIPIAIRRQRPIPQLKIRSLARIDPPGVGMEDDGGLGKSDGQYPLPLPRQINRPNATKPRAMQTGLFEPFGQCVGRLTRRQNGQHVLDPSGGSTTSPNRVDGHTRSLR
jgi:hypothetical protein